VPRAGDCEGTFGPSSQAATCYYQFNHSNVEAIPLSGLPKNIAYLPDCSPHYSYNAEREGRDAISTNF